MENQENKVLDEFEMRDLLKNKRKALKLLMNLLNF